MRFVKSKIALSALFISSLSFSAIAKDAPKKSNKLDTIVVTANPLQRSTSDLAQPVTVLEGDDLLRKMQSTIGETLSQEPGIRSTYFGPNASRPVIRGLEGDQINILQNGINNIDASANSVDHNIPIDPLTIERVEVIRGPAALMYGSKAVGGVVNIIDNRIPSKPIKEKLTGRADAHYNSVNRERSGAILMEGGVGDYAWHINGARRLSDNIRIPGYARSQRLRAAEPLTGGDQENRNKLVNSDNLSESGSVGLSKFFNKGYVGVALTNYTSNYGTVAEEDVTIDMRNQRIDIAGNFEDPFEKIKEIKYKVGLSDYEHIEYEGADVGTVFKNRGYDSRVELVHNKIGSLEGAFGIQSNFSDFSAIGAEAYLAPSETLTNSAFLLEELALDKKWSLQFGGRLDYQRIDVVETPVFGVAKSRDDYTGSGSLGTVYKISDTYSASASAAYTQRAPTAQELYANGAHVATGAFEVGNANLKVQKSQSLDFSLRKEKGILTGEANVFYNRFQDFTTLVATGGTDPDSGFPIYNYVNLPADFYGAEIKANIEAYKKGSHELNFEIRGDYVEARNRTTSEPLARISPPRVGGSVIYDYQKLGFRVDADYTFGQNHVPENESATDGYTMVNFNTDYDVNIGPTSSVLYFRVTNVLNEEARNHVSFLKERTPLPARSFMVGVRTVF